MRTVILATACLLLIMARASAADVSIGSMRDWVIVCDPGAPPSERYAAREFRDLFRQLAGVSLPMVDQVPAGRGAVAIGPDAVRACGGASAEPPRGEEALRIQVRPTALLIDGGRPRGTLYGVYEFFEERCGVRFLTAGATWFPPNAERIRLQIGVRTFVPPFAFRWSYYGETNGSPAFATRLRTNTVAEDPMYGGRAGLRLINSNVASLVPPAVYGAAHPEYYALVGGRRVPGMVDGGGPQLCLTNPAVCDIVVAALLKQLQSEPDVRNVVVGQMDNDACCTCPACAALDAREGSHAGSLITFVNAVAERVERVRPDVLVGTFAFWYTRTPPRTVRPRHNVLVELCSIECCELHALDDPRCARNRRFHRDLLAWRRITRTMLAWHYNTNFLDYMLPYPNLRAIGGSVACLARSGVRGVFMQAAGNALGAEFSDLRNYVMSRCLWKPGRDSWAETRDFCRMYYREAAPVVLAYLDAYHRSVEAREMHPGCGVLEPAVGVSMESARAALAAFASAERLAQSDEVRMRVEKASLCAYRAAISAAMMNPVFDGGECRPDLAAFGAGDLIGRYEALCRKHGATMANEGNTLASSIDGLRRLHTPRRALRIQNATWRLTVLPDENGKVIEMTHLPSGRDVMRSRRPLPRVRYEEWTRAGEGPSGGSILPYTVVRCTPDRVDLALTAKDGARFERTIRLEGDAVRFDTSITAAGARPLDLWLHPEYDAVTGSTDARVIQAYVRRGGAWVQGNRGWVDPTPTPAQDACIAAGVAGGAIAYYNRGAGFGVEQRFDPVEIGAIAFRPWPDRLQVNLEMFPRVTALAAGQRTHYGFEVRYLGAPPTSH